MNLLVNEFAYLFLYLLFGLPIHPSSQVFPERQGKWKATTQSREFLKSIRRYYSNAYTDGEKQDAINLYLFLPVILFLILHL